MRKLLFAAALVGLGLFCSGESATGAAPDDKPKHSISEIMNKAHSRTGITPKIRSGKATKEEKQELLELYVELGKNKPPKGDATLWKKRTEVIVKSTQDLIANKSGAMAKFNKAINCADCHNLHRASE